LPEKSSGQYNICPVCFWEDDIVQLNDPDFSGGANEESLNQGRKNYKLFGACSPRYVGKVRKPLPQERPIKVKNGSTALRQVSRYRRPARKP
jgi:hypothetical protein